MISTTNYYLIATCSTAVLAYCVSKAESKKTRNMLLVAGAVVALAVYLNLEDSQIEPPYCPLKELKGYLNSDEVNPYVKQSFKSIHGGYNCSNYLNLEINDDFEKFTSAVKSFNFGNFWGEYGGKFFTVVEGVCKKTYPITNASHEREAVISAFSLNDNKDPEVFGWLGSSCWHAMEKTTIVKQEALKQFNEEGKCCVITAIKNNFGTIEEVLCLNSSPQ